MWTFIAVFILLTAGYRAQNYDNSAGGLLYRICPTKQVLSLVKSAYANNDRQWKIECKDFISTSDCYWSGFFNLYDQELNYNCPSNTVITGVYSTYNSAYGDRRWNFLCCTAPKFITFECRETPMVNYWMENFSWYVPGDNYLTGVQTRNKSKNGDHRWSFNYCRGIAQDSPTINSQILTANSPVKNYFIEGDVVVPQTRNARICNNCRWPKSGALVQVPYTVSDSFSSSDKTAISSAINSFHLSTCIRFVPYKDQTNYVSIVKKSGCWSLVGQTGGYQEVSLGDGCVGNGIIQHELIHMLGFFHEQSRSDRNIYVTINFQNIQTGLEGNFQQLETNNLNVPYDYSSVMHYGPKDFSKNGGDTITPLSPSAIIGQRIGMSENDILKINKLYSCDDYLHQNGDWDNELNGVVSRQCPSGQAVSVITSNYNKEKKDRLWGVSCKAFEVTRTCSWSGFVNDFRGAMDFKCADQEVIAGVYGDYSSVMADRRWKFYCCRASGSAMFNCRDYPVINYWQEYFSWPVASSNYLTGVKSSFDTQTLDRRWSFTYCQRKLL